MNQKDTPITFGDQSLSYKKFLKTVTIAISDIVWAYTRMEEARGKVCCGTAYFQIHSLVMVLKDHSTHVVGMPSSEEAKKILEELSQYPHIAIGCFKGARLPLQGLPNTRDLGGYRSSDGRMILPRRLIRSGALIKATEQDLAFLTERCHLRRVVDFRTATEREQRPDPEIKDVINIHNPILNEAQTGITRETFGNSTSPYAGLINHASELRDQAASYMESLYGSLGTSTDAAAHYGKFLNLLLEADDDKATLWHCSAGKDRVGLGTALLLSALGIPREVIVADFVKTNDYLKGETEKMAAAAKTITSDPKILDNLWLLNGVKDTYLLSAFSAMEQIYGSVEHYLEQAANFGPDKCRRLRDIYLR